MRQVPNPAMGAAYIRARRRQFPSDDAWRQKFPHEWVSVAENHEERLRVRYPKAEEELDALKAAPVPASFKTAPGHVTGMQLARMGVPGICTFCGELAEEPNPGCKQHGKELPKSSGGVTHGTGSQQQLDLDGLL